MCAVATNNLVEAGKTGDLKDGEMKRVTAGGLENLLAKVGDRYYAAADRCPHMAGDLSRGTLEGTIVTCPRHGSQFDLQDGHAVRWTNWSGIKLALVKMIKPPRPLTTYKVSLREDRIMIQI